MLAVCQFSLYTKLGGAAMVFIGTTAHSVDMSRKPYRKGSGRARHYLKAWRIHRNLTQEQAAERANLTVTQLSKIENGLRGLREDVLYALADSYSCEPGDLYRPPTMPTDELAQMTLKLDAEARQRLLAVAKAMFPNKAA